MTPYESIVLQLAKATNLSKSDVRFLLRELFWHLADQLRQHREVRLRNLGRFRLSSYELEMENLPDGLEEEMWAMAHRISFRASPKFRYRVLGQEGNERAMQSVR